MKTLRITSELGKTYFPMAEDIEGLLQTAYAQHARLSPSRHVHVNVQFAALSADELYGKIVWFLERSKSIQTLPVWFWGKKYEFSLSETTPQRYGPEAWSLAVHGTPDRVAELSLWARNMGNKIPSQLAWDLMRWGFISPFKPILLNGLVEVVAVLL